MAYTHSVRAAPVTVVETNAFVARAASRMTEAERFAAIDMIARDPDRGVVIEGGGGIRKVRFAVGGRGKSGGVRIMYYFGDPRRPVFLTDGVRQERPRQLEQGRAQRLGEGGQGNRAGLWSPAMTKQAFDSIMAGLEDALAYAKGDRRRGKAHVAQVPAVDVRKARRKLGMSQDRFAASFGVSVATVRNWEQGRRRPEGAARVLLRSSNANRRRCVGRWRRRGASCARLPRPLNSRRNKNGVRVDSLRPL